MLRSTRRLPACTRATRESYVAGDVREFCRNRTYEAAEVVVEGRSADSVVLACRRYIRTHPDQCAGVGVALRGGHAYLYRKAAGE